MNSIKHRFTLDMHSSQSQVCIPARLGDTNRSLHINLSEGGSPYFIETGSLVKLTIKRPTGTSIEEFCNIKNNSTVVYRFAQNKNTCAVEGIHECDLVLYGPDGEPIASPKFSMLVSERVIRSDDINLKDTDRTAIDAMVAEEALRQEAEKVRVDAETSRVNAETERVTKANEKINEMDTMMSEVDEKVKEFGGFLNLELPQDWIDINNAYDAIKKYDHKIIGGLIYKDFEGNIQVTPLTPAYGIRTDEVGEKYAQASVAMYNDAQQLLVKPATKGRHTVCLRQLDEFFGGGSTSDVGEDASSLRKIPPVNLTPPINERKPYVFCRDTQNHFAPKYYTEAPHPDELAERDSAGRLRANAPDSSSPQYNDHLVNVDYFNRIVSNAVKEELKKYLPLSGGTLIGTVAVADTRPYYGLVDRSDDNSTSFIQAHQGKMYMGYGSVKSMSVDKDGNAGVAGDLAVVGSLSCDTPTEDDHAVTLGYLNDSVVASIVELTERLNEIADSDDTDLDQLHEIVAYIKNNASLIESITTSKVSTSGGTMTGTLAIQKSNPAVKLIDTSNNTTAFVQMYRDRIRMGYTWGKSLAVDKDGNAEVYGRLSCQTPANDEDAVNLGYLNNKLNAVNTETFTLTYEDDTTRTVEVYVK